MEVHERHRIGRRWRDRVADDGGDDDDVGEQGGAGAGDGVEARANGVANEEGRMTGAR